LKLVKQNKPTNCFAACLASILEIRIADIPEGADGSTWDFKAVQEWLADGYAMQLLQVTFGTGGTIYEIPHKVPCILTGPSPRNCASGNHAVVALAMGLDGFELVHDPHTSDDFLAGEPLNACFFVPIDPLKVSQP
jgi:hypothetical protein